MRLILFVIFLLYPVVSSADIVRVVYMTDKTVRVIYPTGIKSHEETFNEAMEGMDYVGYEEMDSSVLPDRKDRDFWTGKEGEGIKVDSVKKNKATKELEDKTDRKEAIRNKLGLTDKQFEDLKEAIKE